MIIVADRLAKINEICKNNNCVFIECLNIDEHKFQKVQIKFICSCGREDIKTYGALTRFPYCKKCCDTNCGNNKRMDLKIIAEKFKEKKCTLLETEYHNAHTKMKYRCDICGTIQETTWNNFTKIENLCKECIKDKPHDQRMSIDELKSKLAEMNMELFHEDFEYRNRTDTKLPVKCQKCGKLQYRTFAILYRNKKCVCKDCEETRLLSLEQAKEIIYNKYQIELLSYNGHKENCTYRCSCGKINEINYITLYTHGVWCPYCMKTRSKAEEYVKSWLMKNDIEFKYEKTFDNLCYKGKLKIDFYIPEYKVAIEVDGEHHRRDVLYGGKSDFDIIKIRDIMKNNYCRDNNIILVRIPYYGDHIFEFKCCAGRILDKLKKTIL